MLLPAMVLMLLLALMLTVLAVMVVVIERVVQSSITAASLPGCWWV